jgi:hypothetical protein
MFQGIVGDQFNVKKTQHGYAHTKMTLLVLHQLTNIYSWQLIQDLKAKMTVKNTKRQEDSKDASM